MLLGLALLIALAAVLVAVLLPASGSKHPGASGSTSGHASGSASGLSSKAAAKASASALAAASARADASIRAGATARLPVTADPARRGCVAVPSTCGYPDATNTGPPPGTALKSVPEQVSKGTGWHWDSRGWVDVDGKDAVFAGYSVNANVDVTASGVTVADNVIRGSGGIIGVSIRHATGTVVAHNIISGPTPAGGSDRMLVAVKDIYGDESGTQVLGNNIYDVSTGVQTDSGLIADNYIHDLGFAEGDHLNGTTSNAGGTLLTISHNTVLNSRDQTDAVSLFEDFGTQSDRVIDDNLLAGGGYTIYGGANPGGKATSNIKITNNRISTIYFSDGGAFGPLAAFDFDGPGNVFSGNVWDNSGEPVG
jgi:hypothetical protein